MTKEMVKSATPVQYYPEYGLSVKREDLSCPFPGPPFSKARGVWSHIKSRSEEIIGVLDTYHSQAGWAVARACQLLGKKCINYYPEFKYEPGCRLPQLRAKALGAKLVGLKAGRSSILFHQAKKRVLELGGYMMPNALKLPESVVATAVEVGSVARNFRNVLIAVSSGTIAAGVIKGFLDLDKCPRFILHLGYARSHDQVRDYVRSASGYNCEIEIVDERYSYKDQACDGPTPPWPCNPYYDLKAFRWWIRSKSNYLGDTLFWNIG